MQVFITATPGMAQEAAKPGKPLANLAYRIGEGAALLRQNLLMQTHGGLLAVTDCNVPVINDPEALCQAVLRECGRRSYTGVLLDFEDPRREDLASFAQQLGNQLSSGRRLLYVPEAYAGPNRIVLINTAVSGGTYADRLREAAARYGGTNRLALDVQRLQMDFPLPSPSGEGKFLSSKEFQTLIKEKDPSTFFSQELCARYFTYIEQEIGHFVLYDDAGSLRQKLRIGAQMGFAAAFFQWPEISDLASSLFSAK